MAIIRMSRYFDLSNNAVLFYDVMLPVGAFLTTHISEEMTLVNKIFEFAREIAQMKLSEKVLSLYSAFILLQDGECLQFKTFKTLIMYHHDTKYPADRIPSDPLIAPRCYICL